MVGIWGASAALNPNTLTCGLDGVGNIDQHCHTIATVDARDRCPRAAHAPAFNVVRGQGFAAAAGLHPRRSLNLRLLSLNYLQSPLGPYPLLLVKTGPPGPLYHNKERHSDNEWSWCVRNAPLGLPSNPRLEDKCYIYKIYTYMLWVCYDSLP